jgi:hypothetical protein
MSEFSFSDQLTRIEQQFNEISAILLDGNPHALESASSEFQQLSVVLIQMLNRIDRNTLKQAAITQRLKHLTEGVSVLRANLLRRSALVDQALKIVVPVDASSTYSEGGPYGAVARQTGAFKYLAA